jgi:hypothetical protein
MIDHGPTLTGIERKRFEDKPVLYPLDFCKWLQSEEFGVNRRALLEGCGACWLTC